LRCAGGAAGASSGRRRAAGRRAPSSLALPAAPLPAASALTPPRELLPWEAAVRDGPAVARAAEDTLPTVGELRREWARKQALVRCSGYSAADVPALVEATLPQRRLLALVPQPTAAEDLGDLLRSSMVAY
jgi:hypothetical protein